MDHRSLCRQAGLTLVEVLIVVILMGIVAAMAIPRFSTTTKDVQASTLEANLSALRNAIELYAAQHGGRFPGQYDAADGTTPAATAAAAQDAFRAQLTQYTDANGKTSATLDTTHYPFGPYLRKGIPENPMPTPSNTLVVDMTASGAITGKGGTGGWKFATKTGQIIANHPDDKDR